MTRDRLCSVRAGLGYALTIGVLVVCASCSTSVQNAKPTDPTAVSDSSTAHTVNDDTDATDTTVTPQVKLDVDDLWSVLPSEAIVGREFTATDMQVGSSGEPDASDRMFERECPGLASLLDTMSDDPTPYAGRSFNADDNRSIIIYLFTAGDPKIGFTTKKDLDELVDDLTACPPLETSNEVLEIEAESDDSFGDFGAHLTLTVSPVDDVDIAPRTGTVQVFRVGSAFVGVQAMSGWTRNGAASTVDQNLVASLTRNLESQLRDLQQDS